MVISPVVYSADFCKQNNVKEAMHQNFVLIRHDS